MYKFSFSLEEHIISYLHLKFLSYALNQVKLQEIAMPSVITFLLKLF